MKSAFTIRPAKNHDAKKIFQFLCELEESLFDQQEFDLNYQSCLSATINIYLVATNDNNDPVGYISCHGQLVLHHGGMVYEIQELFVEKKYRNKGVGKLLLKALEENLSKRESRSLEVSTTKWRVETRKFYAGFG